MCKSCNSAANQMVAHCESVLDLENAILSDSYYYPSLPLCVIDAVFSIGVRYASTRKVVESYSKSYNLPILRNRTSGYPDRESQHTISQLVGNIEKVGTEHFAKNIFCNSQRTSSTSGILKSEAVYIWAKILKQHEIECFQDLSRIDEKVEAEITSIKGQKSGLSLSYFYMLSGNDELCKPDRHILNFISKALQKEVKSRVEAQTIMCDTVTILEEKYPNVTVRLLDNTIWAYMSR